MLIEMPCVTVCAVSCRDRTVFLMSSISATYGGVFFFTLNLILLGTKSYYMSLVEIRSDNLSGCSAARMNIVQRCPAIHSAITDVHRVP